MRRTVQAFSLIEVIVAVALFATSLTVILALLPALTLRKAETADRLLAHQLPDALQAELRRLAAPGLDRVAEQVPAMGAPPENGLAFVATREGARLHSRDYLPPTSEQISAGDQYYLLECWRFPSGVLQFDAAQSTLAHAARVSWPYHPPGSTTPTNANARHEFMFVIGVNR